MRWSLHPWSERLLAHDFRKPCMEARPLKSSGICALRNSFLTSRANSYWPVRLAERLIWKPNSRSTAFPRLLYCAWRWGKSHSPVASAFRLARISAISGTIGSWSGSGRRRSVFGGTWRNQSPHRKSSHLRAHKDPTRIPYHQEKATASYRSWSRPGVRTLERLPALLPAHSSASARIAVRNRRASSSRSRLDLSAGLRCFTRGFTPTFQGLACAGKTVSQMEWRMFLSRVPVVFSAATWMTYTQHRSGVTSPAYRTLPRCVAGARFRVHFTNRRNTCR